MLSPFSSELPGAEERPGDGHAHSDGTDVLPGHQVSADEGSRDVDGIPHHGDEANADRYSC